MDRLQTGKHAMDSNTSQIPRTRSSRPTSTHRAWQSTGEKEKMKETEKNRSAHKQPSYLLIRSQQCQAELERVERQEEVCITNRSAFIYYVLGSCRSRQYTSEFITDHASYEEMKKNESRLESDRGTKGTTPKRGGRKRQKNHTRQVCSCLVVVETERK